MADRDELLSEFTNKDVEEVGRRVFYTLTEDKARVADRLAFALSMLVEQLHERELISERDVDDLLLKAAGY